MSIPPQLFRTLDNLKDQAKDAFLALSSCLCQQSAKVKINGRTFKIIKVLGEGGFSFVYLAQDEHSGREFALKKIRCPTGSDAVKEAMREVEAYRRFRHPNIIRILDSAVVQDPDGEGKIVYLFLPLYQRGNIQDRINSNVVNGSHFPEQEMVRLFKGTCEAIRAMHTYRPPSSQNSNPNSNSNSNSNANGNSHRTGNANSNSNSNSNPNASRHSDDEDEDARFPEPEGDGDEGYSYDGRGAGAGRSRGGGGRGSGSDGTSVPLITKHRVEDQGDVVFDGDEEVSGLHNPDIHGEQGSGASGGAGSEGARGEIVPYAHRDIKPGNVMISDDGKPILMDFGSALKARIPIETRSQALYQQDIAAEQSTMAYRAPELFDVKTGVMLDEKVDIWSLGCTLFAMAYSHSPFENTQTTEQGGSIAMAVLNAQYKHPQSASGTYSQGLRDLIDSMLRLDPRERPDVHKVIEMADQVLQSLA